MNKLIQAIWENDPQQIADQMGKIGVNYRADNDTALVAAARMGNNPLVQVLLGNGCKAQSQNWAALKEAVNSGDRPTVLTLLEAASDFPQESRRAILDLAIVNAEKNAKFDPMVVDALLSHNFGEDARTGDDPAYYNAPFLLSIQLGVKRVFERFLEYGYGQADQYRAALKHAVMYARPELCRELLSMGADLDSISDELLEIASTLKGEAGKQVLTLIKRYIVDPPKKKRAELEAAFRAWKPEGEGLAIF